MKAKLKLDNPEEMEATMEITMTILEWKRLRESVMNEPRHPEYPLNNAILELIKKAQKGFELETETDGLIRTNP